MPTPTVHVWFRRARLLASWLLALDLARMYFNMGWIKFDPAGFWTAAFEHWGYPPWFRILIGVLEVGGALTVVVPWTATYGAATLAVVMLGAWVTRAHDGRWVDVAWIAAYFVGLVWIGYEWRSFRLRPRRRAPAQARASADDGDAAGDRQPGGLS